MDAEEIIRRPVSTEHIVGGLFWIAVIALMSVAAPAATLTVGPGAGYDYSSIQDGINAANDGDTVLVARGHYYEALSLDLKSITLASNYINSHDEQDILQTIVDGSGTGTGLTVLRVAPDTSVRGLTFQNCNDGISAMSKFNLLHCRIINCVDGLDYEGGGGLCKFNVFENNRDDGIDLDDDVDAVIAYNSIINNRDDGIEIRLHNYEGPGLTCLIAGNIILGNGEDGIQLIDYPGVTARVYHIENNVIARNSMAAIGCMSDGNTVEDYQAADIPERVYVTNNTFVDNNYGITGGDNMIMTNNIFARTSQTALKNVDGGSSVRYNAFRQNTPDFYGTTPGIGNIYADPRFADVDNGDYHLKSRTGRWDPVGQQWVRDEVTSECIDAGDPSDSSWVNELWRHGGLINMGAYGGTTQASMSDDPVGNPADLDHNDSVDTADLLLFTEDWAI